MNSQKNMNKIFESWTKLGVRFSFIKPSLEEPIIEKLISETIIYGRDEPRLLECMAAWLDQCGDLVNVSLLKHFISKESSSILGIILELINHKKLNQFIKYCVPKENAEMLFNVDSNIMKAEAVTNATEINKKWNLYFVSFRIKRNALMNRKYVLENNPNLARRALFGVSLKTEIINFILNNENVYAANISKYFGCHYHLISNEISRLIEDGIIKSTQIQRKNILKLIPTFQNYFCTIPF